MLVEPVTFYSLFPGIERSLETLSSAGRFVGI